MSEYKANLRVARQEITVHFELNYLSQGRFCSFCRKQIGQRETLSIQSIVSRGVNISILDPLGVKVAKVLSDIVGHNVCVCVSCDDVRHDLLDRRAQAKGIEVEFLR